MKSFRKRICPRCNEKYKDTAISVCEVCGFKFTRLENATNKAAKKMLKQNKKDYVVYTSELPRDINKTRLALYCVFLGLFGAHYFYVGRIKKAIVVLALYVVALVGTAASSYGWLSTSVINFFFTIPGASLAIIWLFDIVNIIFEKFKVPVAIDIAK